MTHKFNTNKNVIIYKLTGGLNHMLSGLNYTYRLALENNCYIIIDSYSWYVYPFSFCNMFKIHGNVEYYDNYDNIDHNLTWNNIPIKDIINNRAKWISPNNYTINNITSDGNKFKNNKLNIIASSGHNWNINNNDFLYKLKLLPHIINNIEANFIPSLQKKLYISVHFRNTDINNDINITITKIKKAMVYYNIKTVFIATDDYTAFNAIKDSIKDIDILQYTILEEKNIRNLHYNSINKEKQFYDCLTDIYHILCSNYFIPSYNSGLSRLILEMIKIKSNIFNIVSNTIELN